MSRFVLALPAAAAFRCLFLVVLAASAGCTFNVNLPSETPFPVRLNPIPIRPKTPDRSAKTGRSEEEKKKDAEQAIYREVVKNRRNRNSQIRDLKNGRVIGENHKGLLTVQENLDGTGWESKLDYVRETVDAENRDRNYLIEREATQRGKPEVEIRRNMWRQWQRRSFEGEWIEVRAKDAGTYRWIQKPGTS